MNVRSKTPTGVLISPQHNQEGNKLQQPNSNFCKPLKFKRLSVRLGLRGSNDLHVRRKMVTFQLILQSGQAKDLSAPLILLSPFNYSIRVLITLQFYVQCKHCEECDGLWNHIAAFGYCAGIQSYST
jgi:hypothetical protein